MKKRKLYLVRTAAYVLSAAITLTDTVPAMTVYGEQEQKTAEQNLEAEQSEQQKIQDDQTQEKPEEYRKKAVGEEELEDKNQNEIGYEGSEEIEDESKADVAGETDEVGEADETGEEDWQEKDEIMDDRIPEEETTMSDAEETDGIETESAETELQMKGDILGIATQSNAKPLEEEKDIPMEALELLETKQLVNQEMMTRSSIGDLWPSDYGQGADLYSEEDHDGTEESPYWIDSVEDLRLFAAMIAQGQFNEDTWYLLKAGIYDLNGSWIPVGFYRNNVNTNPIAFKGHFAAEDDAEIVNLGFAANGVLGLDSTLMHRILDKKEIGFFGILGDGATVTGLHIDTDGNTIQGGEGYTGILAGSSNGAVIRECSVYGKVSGCGYTGGLVGYAKNTVMENVSAGDPDGGSVAVYQYAVVNGGYAGGHNAVGGITGYAEDSAIVDAFVKTNSGAGNHIYGNNAYCGGITGIMDNTHVLNTFVESGEIGTSEGYANGGLVGGYYGGKLKVGRFSGTMVRPSSTNHYSACFIGTRYNNKGFTYGETGDVAFLFADSSDKAMQGICGSKTINDSDYNRGANIGYWHPGDKMYTLLTAGSSTDSKDFFYEELEKGILSIRKNHTSLSATADHVACTKTIDHFAADEAGNPVRGYLLNVTDPVVNGQKAAKITAYVLDNSYQSAVTSESLGAFEAGETIYVKFADLSGDHNYYVLNTEQPDNPWVNYYEKDVFRVYDSESTQEALNTNGGFYFTMPESDATIGAAYKAAGQNVAVTPANLRFDVTQTRTGARDNPVIEWKVTAYNGTGPYASVITDAKNNAWNNRILATKNSGETELNVDAGAVFWLGSLVNEIANGQVKEFNLDWAVNNQVSDSTARSNRIITNLMPGGPGITAANAKNATFTLNVVDSMMAEQVKKLEEQQKQDGYKSTITTQAPYVYHSIISAAMQADDASDKNSIPVGYCDVTIRLNVVDHTTVSVTGAQLNKNVQTYNVVRTITGDRNHPENQKTIFTVNGSVLDRNDSDLAVSFHPDYFSSSAVNWYLSDLAVEDQAITAVKEMDKNAAVEADFAKKDDGTIAVLAGMGNADYKNASVRLKGITANTCDNAWISSIIASQDAFTAANRRIPDTVSTYKKYVKVTGKDSVNASATDTCLVIVNFRTDDQTVIRPDRVEISDASNLDSYNIYYTFKGNNSSEITKRSISYVSNGSLLTNGEGQKVSARIYPDIDTALVTDAIPYNKKIIYSIANPKESEGSQLNVNDVLMIDKDTGVITVRGFSDSKDQTDPGYSPWAASLISQNQLNGTTVPVRIFAVSEYDQSVYAYKDINVTFRAASMESAQERGIEFYPCLTRNVNSTLADTEVSATEVWSGLEPIHISAVTSGTSEVPAFTVYEVDDNGNKKAISSGSVTLGEVSFDPVTKKAETTVSVNKNASWITAITRDRKNSGFVNTGTRKLLVEAKTSGGTSVAQIPVTIVFRYEGVDMKAEKITVSPDEMKYPTSPMIPNALTKEETYDPDKAQVNEANKTITLGVHVTQGHYTNQTAETRKWSYGIAKLSDLVYTDAGRENTASFELSGDAAAYLSIDENGYLTPNKGSWETSVIQAGKTGGCVTGIVTAHTQSSTTGEMISDSYKVVVNFTYEKAVLDEHELVYDVVLTQDVQTGSVKATWNGNASKKLTATITDQNGQNITPEWSTDDSSVVTVDSDGNVTPVLTTWMKDIVDEAQTFGVNRHSGTKTAVVTAKKSTTHATADSAVITVNFRYDQVILDRHEEVYNLVKTQTSRTIDPQVTWTGNDRRILNAKTYVAPGADQRVRWATEDPTILMINEDGVMEPVIDAAWQEDIIAGGGYKGKKTLLVSGTNHNGSMRDQAAVTVNFCYEDIVLDQNHETYDVTITASGNRANPSYSISGKTSGSVHAVMHSAVPGENKIVYDSKQKDFLNVSEEGRIEVILPASMDSYGFAHANSLFSNAVVRPYSDSVPQFTTQTCVVTAASEDGRMADQEKIVIRVKYLDRTVSTSSSGGSSGGSGSGGSSGGGGSTKGTTLGSSVTKSSAALPSYVVTGGTWSQTADHKWIYTGKDRVYTNEWAAIQNPYADISAGQRAYDWYRFGADSFMVTGWYTDTDGRRYYLSPVSDGTQGKMVTGWVLIDGYWYYFNHVSDGTMGALLVNSTTPDGKTVGADGRYLVDGRPSADNPDPEGIIAALIKEMMKNSQK